MISSIIFLQFNVTNIYEKIISWKMLMTSQLVDKNQTSCMRAQINIAIFVRLHFVFHQLPLVFHCFIICLQKWIIQKSSSPQQAVNAWLLQTTLGSSLEQPYLVVDLSRAKACLIASLTVSEKAREKSSLSATEEYYGMHEYCLAR